MTPQTLKIRKPDDCHIHLRDHEALSTTVPHVASRFARAIVMPNLKPPVTSIKSACEYQARILKALPRGTTFNPLMTLYLTDDTSRQTVLDAKACESVIGFKLYPAGATTHSEAGVKEIQKLAPIFEEIQKQGLALLVHGESTNPAVDIFDREKVFIDETLSPLLKKFPSLKVVLEHITTEEAVAFVREAAKNVGATLTAHHLLYSRNDLFQGGIHPHLYCLPILKRKKHQAALIATAISGNPKFFLGSDSAPHPQSQKESACGCAGIYTAHAALELYAEIFEKENALDKLEAFASEYGARFYGLPLNTEYITLKKEVTRVPDAFPLGSEKLIPLLAGKSIGWKI